MSRPFALPLPLEEMPCVVRADRMDPPIDWAGLFGRRAPVELEIGSGKGLFLVRAASERADHDFLGVERAGKYFRRGVIRIHKSGLPNIRVFKTDAFDLLDRWIPPGSLAAVHVYFPDPWPKKRHAKRRLLQPLLYERIARSLPGGAPFCLGSDVGEYFREAVREILGSGLFEQVEWPAEAPDRIATSYAVKYEREGRSLHYAKFLRRGERPDPAST